MKQSLPDHDCKNFIKKFFWFWMESWMMKNNGILSWTSKDARPACSTSALKKNSKNLCPKAFRKNAVPINSACPLSRKSEI